MPMITVEMLQAMEQGLKSSLPLKLSNFVYELEADDDLLVGFNLETLPTREELQAIREAAYAHIDANIPKKPMSPSWTASVKVGASRIGDVLVGGVQIDTLEGGSLMWPKPPLANIDQIVKTYDLKTSGH